MKGTINPRTSAGLSTLAAIVGQWGDDQRFHALRKGLREASEQMKRYEEAVDAAVQEYETESWTEDTQGALAECQEEAER